MSESSVLKSLFASGAPILMAIVGPSGARSAREALDGGADLIQVRAKELSIRDLIELVRDVVETTGRGERIVVNGRPDVGSLAGCAGVHLPETGFEPRTVRRAYPGLVIGVSRHDRSGLDEAERQGADYALLGTVWASPGKSESVLGLEQARQRLAGIGLPVLAVGGVDQRTGRWAQDAGFRGGAALRPFLQETEAADAARSLKAALNSRSKGDLS